jgi:hypothetical protein
VEGTPHVKDRARPFSRKHFRYWMTAAGGMVIIMVINVLLGFWLLGREKPAMPTPKYHDIPASTLPIDAGVDAPSLPDDVER